MNLEGISLSMLTAYLAKAISGGRIHKISMPTPHCLLIALNCRHGAVNLVFEGGAGGPALFITDKAPENPAMPPSFCMLLRKHLDGGRITAITQKELDRVITFDIDLIGPSSKLITKKLIFELAGRNNNVILVHDEIIIDSLKHISVTQNSYRTVLPGCSYKAPPPQAGLNVLDAPPELIVQAACLDAAPSFTQKLINSTTGIGKASAQELLSASGIDPKSTEINQDEAYRLTAKLREIQKSINLERSAIAYTVISSSGQVKLITPLKPQLSRGAANIEEFPDINAAINYAISLKPTEIPQREHLKRISSSEISKLKRKLAALKEDLNRAEDANVQRIIADTIMANAQQLRKGDKTAKLANIYSGEPMLITLAPMLTPFENAQRYYKLYNKLKRAQTEVKLQIKSAEDALAYLESIDASLITAAFREEIAEIQQELEAAGLLKKIGRKKARAHTANSTPLHLQISENTELFIGKNNKQNDYVTFSVGAPRDLWLHAKDIPGSHVILKTKLPVPRQEEVLLAAQIAAYFSKGRDGSNVPVDYTERRYVKKPSGSKPGFVIFTNQRTYYVTPDRETIMKYIS